MEIWKDVQHFEGLYQVSNLGRVRSLDRIVSHKNGTKSKRSGRILRQIPSSGGYLRVCLSKDGKTSNPLIHRLMAIAFVETDDTSRCINHINLDKTDNESSNLEWVTHKENTSHAIANGKRPNNKGEINGSAKVTEEQVVEIRKLYKSGMTQKQLGDIYGLDASTVSSMVNRKTWTHI